MLFFSVKNLTYTVGNDSRMLTVNAELDEHHVLVIEGPSGSGKTTLLRILARLQGLVSGECYLDDQSWLEISPENWRRMVFYLHQRPTLFDGTVLENLQRPFEINLAKEKKSNFDINQAKELLLKLLLPTDILKQDARTLSGGEIARVAFVRALLISPRILLLDEPTAALDISARNAFYDVLNDWLEEGRQAVILVSHNLELERIKSYSRLNLTNLAGE